MQLIQYIKVNVLSERHVWKAVKEKEKLISELIYEISKIPTKETPKKGELEKNKDTVGIIEIRTKKD